MHLPKGVVRAAAMIAATIVLVGFGIRAGARIFLTGDRSDLQPLTLELRPRDFDIVIPANGELQSSESLAVAVPNVPVERLRIASIVPEGRHVSKGDVLVEFDPAELDLEALENRTNLEMTQQKINKGESSASVERTDISKDRKIAELELAKINEFLPKDEQIYSRREIIEGQLDKSYTEKRIVFADARLELKGKVYSLDEAILMLERQQANAKIAQVEKGLASLKLLAPASGVVVPNDSGFFWGGFSLLPGRVVWIGMTVFNLVNPERMEAKCFVLEKDAGELRVGQRATITLDPFPGISYSGRVRQIDSLARPIDRDSPVKYFQAIVEFDRVEPKYMRPGVKVKARIAAGQLKSVIVVPRSAVVKKDARPAVLVRTGTGQYEPVPIKPGHGDLVQVVVDYGVKPGQRIALNPPDLKRESSGTQKGNGGP